MELSAADLQRRRRAKMAAKDLSLVSVWVPKDRVVEIKAIGGV